jgi:hypothetical protein
MRLRLENCGFGDERSSRRDGEQHVQADEQEEV